MPGTTFDTDMVLVENRIVVACPVGREHEVIETLERHEGEAISAMGRFVTTVAGGTSTARLAAGEVAEDAADDMV